MKTYKTLKLRSPKSIYSFNFCQNFFYIKRIRDCLRENGKTYLKISEFIKKYFCSVENHDIISGDYIEIPVVLHEDYYEYPIPKKECDFMNSLEYIKHGNLYDPVSGKNIYEYEEFEIMKIKEYKKWRYYHIETLFNTIFENHFFGNLNIQQIDFVCYKYSKYLDDLNIGVQNTPYTGMYKQYKSQLHGRYYKYHYITRINKFISLFNEKLGIYNSPLLLSRLWGKFYLNKGLFGCCYIPWCIPG
jgi:hypothetical protein